MTNLDRRRFLAAAGLFGAGLAAGCTPTAVSGDQPPPPLDPAVGPMINGFGIDLHAKLAAKPGNQFASPFSISTALGMTAAGARGTTLEQMAKLLRLPADPGDSDRRYRGLLGSLVAKPGYELTTANAVWAQKGYPWRPEFRERIEKFGAALRDADFARNADAERKAINAWVESQTKSKIKDLFADGTLDSDTRMALVNAVYFKGKWADPFDKRFTTDEPFLAAGGTKTKVPMMRRKARHLLHREDGLQVLVLPYQGNDLSMVIALPEKPDGLPALEKTLKADSFDAWAKAAKPTNDVQVVLPKFQIETKYELNDTLATMGMPDAFIATKADFTGMHSSPERLFISIVVHKAFVDVNEEGTEAAAATGVGMAKLAAPITKPIVFRADHPFLFAIRHHASGAMLFLGRVETL
jgi:serpin B